MKKQNITLKLLIDRMSAAEKRVFKIYATAYEGTKKYLQLFEAIESQRIYNESELKTSFKGNFPVLKKYLFDSIIESLKQSGDYKDLDSYHVHEIEKYKILKHKGLDKAAEIQLRRTKKMTLEDEGYIKHLYALNQEYVAVFTKDSNLEKNKLKYVIEERKKVLAIITNYGLVSDVYFNLRLALKSIYYCKTKSDVKLLEALLTPIKHFKESDLLSNTSKSMYYMAMNEYYTAIGAYDKALISSSTYLNLKRSQSGNNIELQTVLENASYLLLSLKCAKLFNFSEKLEWLETIMNSSTQPFRFLFCYERWYVIKLRYSQLIHTTQASEQFMLKENSRFKKHVNSFSLKYKASAYYFNALSNYLAKDFKSALHNCNQLINNLDNGLEEFLYARLLRIFIYVNQENYFTIDFECRSLTRLMQKEVLSRQNELRILKAIQKSPDFSSKDWKQFLAKSKSEFTKDKTLTYYLSGVLNLKY
jgi:hypothetical protein